MPPEVETGGVLKGQVALVIGASSGGGAAARELARAGADVVVNDAGNPAGAQATADAVAAVSGRAYIVEADVNAEAGMKSLFAAVVRAFGRLDILAVNAAIQCDAGFADMTAEKWFDVAAVGLTRQFLWARAAVRQFLAQPPPRGSSALGKIIFMSDLPEATPWAVEISGAASRSGLSFLMQSLSSEIAGREIRINGVSPGVIRASGDGICRTSHDLWDTSKPAPYGCAASSEDIGRAVVWLASDASDDFTGTMFYVVGKRLYVGGGLIPYPEF